MPRINSGRVDNHNGDWKMTDGPVTDGIGSQNESPKVMRVNTAEQLSILM